MTKRVVDALEKIDVEHHDGESDFFHTRLGHRRLKLLKKAATIDQIGEEIFGRQLFEFLVHARHRFDHKARERNVERDKHQRERDQQ